MNFGGLESRYVAVGEEQRKGKRERVCVMAVSVSVGECACVCVREREREREEKADEGPLSMLLIRRLRTEQKERI